MRFVEVKERLGLYHQENGLSAESRGCELSVSDQDGCALLLFFLSYLFIWLCWVLVAACGI